MSEKLTRNQRKAIQALLEFTTIEEVAEAIGVNPRTVYRWLDDASFRNALSRAEGEMIDRVTRRLLVLGDKAIEAIEDILDNPDQRGAGNKRLASQAILGQLLKLWELRNIEQRVTALEELKRNE